MHCPLRPFVEIIFLALEHNARTLAPQNFVLNVMEAQFGNDISRYFGAFSILLLPSAPPPPRTRTTFLSSISSLEGSTENNVFERLIFVKQPAARSGAVRFNRLSLGADANACHFRCVKLSWPQTSKRGQVGVLEQRVRQAEPGPDAALHRRAGHQLVRSLVQQVLGKRVMLLLPLSYRYDLFTLSSLIACSMLNGCQGDGNLSPVAFLNLKHISQCDHITDAEYNYVIITQMLCSINNLK